MNAGPLFTLGTIVITPGANAALHEAAHGDVMVAGLLLGARLRRHAFGDWGDLSEEDRQMNDDAVISGEDRILSAYTLETGVKLWIITEADRSATTVLLPEEY